MPLSTVRLDVQFFLEVFVMASFSWSNACCAVSWVIVVPPVSIALITWNPFIGFLLTALFVFWVIRDLKKGNFDKDAQLLEKYYGPEQLLKCPACGTSTRLSRWIRVKVLVTYTVSDGHHVVFDKVGRPLYRSSRTIKEKYTANTTDYNTIRANYQGADYERKTVGVKKIDLICPSCSKRLNHQEIQELKSKAIQIQAKVVEKERLKILARKEREQRLICQDCNVSSPESDWAEHGCCPNCGSDREPYPDPKSPVNMISEKKKKKAPIMNAVNEGNLELVRQLIKAGANVNVKDKDAIWFANFPMTLAASLGHLEIVQELIKAGADVNPGGDSTPLHAAEKNLEIVKELIKAGADVNAKDNDGETPLHYAVGSDRFETVQELIKAGADVNAKNDGGDTPLSSTYHDEIISLLKENGVTE